MESRSAWAVLGVACGAAFPGIALIVRAGQLGVGAGLTAFVSDPVTLFLVFVPVLGAGFAFLAGRELDEVRTLAASLEELVDERTARVAESHRALAAAAADRERLLATLCEGVASFDAEGRLGAERSPAFDQLIPHAAEAETIDRLLEICGAETETVAIVRHLLWGKDSANTGEERFEAATAMLPKAWTVSVDGRRRHLGFHYRPLYRRPGVLDRVVLLVEDQTPHAQALDDHHKTLSRVARLSAAASDFEAYGGFVDGVAAKLEAAQQARKAPDAPSDQLLANLHTLKSTLGIFAYTDAAEICHQIEQAYAVGDPTSGLWTRLQRTWRQQSTDVAKTLGLGRGRTISVAPERLVALRQALGRSDLDAARRAALEFSCHPLTRIMSRYERYVAARAERAGKQVRFVVADGANEVAYHEVQRVDSALIHIFNNVVAHAAVMGTPVVMTVNMVRREDGGTWWTVEDDGVGIDSERLAAIAVQSSLRTDAWARGASDDAKLGLVFQAGLSTKTGSGGRGIGLSAARATMRALGGDMRVASAVGAGTRFELWVPGQASMDLRRWSDLQQPQTTPSIPPDEWVSQSLEHATG